MNLQAEIMELIGDEWITGKELAEQIANKNPEEVKERYQGNISVLTKALGPALMALRNQKKILDNAPQYPEPAKWKRVESKKSILVEDAARALIKLNLAKDESQAIRMIASRTIREHKPEFERLIKEAKRVNEEALKIGEQILGIKSETD